MAKRDLISKIILGVSLVLGVIALRVWFFEPLTIQPHMVNGNLSEKDIVMVLKQDPLTYGDLVAYQVDGESYVGRIIAMPGDSVTYMENVLYRNQEIITEPYVHQSVAGYTTEDMVLGELPKGQYFLLNDHRSNQKDSRHFGLIEQSAISGRIGFRIFPLKEFGFIDNDLAQ